MTSHLNPCISAQIVGVEGTTFETVNPGFEDFRRGVLRRLLEPGIVNAWSKGEHTPMTILTSIYARVFNYTRDIYGNRTAHFAILRGDTLRELHTTKRRRQVGYGEENLGAVTVFLKSFEGGEWNRVSILHQPSGEVLAKYERDLERAFTAAATASSAAAQDYHAASNPGAKAAALEKWNAIGADAHRLGVALNEAEAAAERSKR